MTKASNDNETELPNINTNNHWNNIQFKYIVVSIIVSICVTVFITNTVNFIASVEQPSPVSSEISIKSNWSHFIQTNTNHSILSIPIPNKEIYLISSVISPQESAVLLQEAEKFGFGTTNCPKDYRGNLSSHD